MKLRLPSGTATSGRPSRSDTFRLRFAVIKTPVYKLRIAVTNSPVNKLQFAVKKSPVHKLRTAAAVAIAMLLLLPIPQTASGNETIFPGLTGNELVDSLRVHYRPSAVMSSYNTARDQLFGVVHLDNNTLTCAYTGDQFIYNPDDPDGRSVRIQAQEDAKWNTEHIWPQSQGASSGNARIDMHHLRPVRGDVNSSRSNYPFASLDAAEVTRWWKGDVSQDDIPAGDHSLWSKTRSTAPARFEVYDESKGDVARAMFYFYTMYPNEVRNANYSYLYIQMDDLRAWHNLDQVTEDETGWTWEIAAMQDGKPNPFVVDTTLVRRAYFENYQQWDPSDVELSDPDAFEVSYTFSGTIDCEEQNPWPAIPEDRVAASAMQRDGVLCNAGGGVFNSRGWPQGGEKSDGHYVFFDIEAAGRALDFSNGATLEYSIERSGTGPVQIAWYYLVDGGNFELLDDGSMTSTNNLNRFVSLAGLGDDIQHAEFRLYGWDAGSQNGTMRINELSVEGRLLDEKKTWQRTIEGSHPGWRMLSVPVQDVSFADLAHQNLIEGVEGINELYAEAYPGKEFEQGMAPNVGQLQRNGSLYEWPPPDDVHNNIPSGTGFIWYFYNKDKGPSKSLPFTLSLDGVEPAADVDVSLTGDWNLVGNPYGTGMEWGHIVYIDGMGDVIGPVTGAQTWDPEAGDGSGSYEFMDLNTPVEAWQGFFVENNGADKLRFRYGGRLEEQESGKQIAGGGVRYHSVRFSLTGVHRDDAHRTIDQALSLALFEDYPDGSGGLAPYNMGKLTPLTERFATLAFQKPSDTDGTGSLAQWARMIPDGGSKTLPMILNLHDMAGDFDLKWSVPETLPAAVSVILEDRLTGDRINVRESEGWAFEADSDSDPDRLQLVMSADLSTDVPGVDLPDRWELAQNYPNPFNPVTKIGFDVPERAHVRLAVYDMLGRQVAVLADGIHVPGSYSAGWDGGRHASGVYIYVLEADGGTERSFRAVRKMMLIK